ncbi:MAG: hypothetical protein RLZZ353_1505 [Actinomycetota bacterium]
MRPHVPTRRRSSSRGAVRRAALIAALTVALAACGASDDATDVTPIDPAGTRPAGSGEDFGPAGEDPASVAPPIGAVDARLADLDDLTAEVEAALADASERSGVPLEAIAVASALAVTWSDGSLGCPQPDMAYTMALVPGYLLTLEVAGERVAYHGAAGDDPFPCGWPAE